MALARYKTDVGLPQNFSKIFRVVVQPANTVLLNRDSYPKCPCEPRQTVSGSPGTFPTEPCRNTGTTFPNFPDRSGQKVRSAHHDHTHQAATIIASFHLSTHTNATGNSSSLTQNGTGRSTTTSSTT